MDIRVRRTHIYDMTIGHVIPGPVLGYRSFQTIAVLDLRSTLLDHHPKIIISVAFFSASKIIDCVLNFDFLPKNKSLTFPDNWRIIYIPWLSSDWKTLSDFPWLFPDLNEPWPIHPLKQYLLNCQNTEEAKNPTEANKKQKKLNTTKHRQERKM